MLRNEIQPTEGLEVPMNHPLSEFTDQFLRERLYLKNVSDRTLVWYRVAFGSYCRLLNDHATLPTRATLQEFVVRLRERGVRPVTCNTYVAAMNAFCAWLHQEGHASERVKLAKLRVDRRMLTLLDDSQMRALITYKPRGFGQVRVQLAAVLVLDTGLRISEALNLRKYDVDFDNLIIKALGKGAEGPICAVFSGAAKASVSFRPVKNAKGYPQRHSLRWPWWDAMGETEQHHLTAFDAAKARPAKVRLASLEAHVFDQLSPAGRRHRALVDGARTLTNHDDAEIPPPAHRRSLRESPASLDPEPARLNAGSQGAVSTGCRLCVC
jgi:integrase